MSSAPSPKKAWKTDLREQNALRTSPATVAWLPDMEKTIIKNGRAVENELWPMKAGISAASDQLAALNMIWQELTSPDFGAIDRATPVLLPVAAIEQHGPHLPLATDRMIVEFLVERLNARLGPAVLTLPTVPVGCSDHHMDFAGSLTLRQETFVNACAELLDAARRHGFRNFLVLNSHGGNQGACQVLLERFGADHLDCRIAVATWWRAASEALLALNETGPGGVGHACEFETSLMLLIAPHLVRMEKIPSRANAPTFDWAEGDLLRSPRVALFRTMKQMTPHGAYGDPSKATAAKGKQIAGCVCDALSVVLRDLAK